MKVVVIDNFDSFTYNLVHYLEALNAEVTVFRNDDFELNELEIFDKIVLSPGPGIPSEAGLLMKTIEKFYLTKPILGVCLGHQAIAEFFGGKLINLSQVFHGIATPISISDNSETLYQNLPKNFSVGRYHSWIVSKENFPENLQITAVDNDQNIMSFSHKTLNIKAIQFHPESIMTEFGKEILKNWLES
ncbi:aminodeoxychorismate/anthranilate synthase component II [Flavobacterium sp. NST-5]|uniref:Aminodeoxychorismate/anthranilate synthase component II n=1 Tax=Flavobacterium ichthyis TaxID=2698827 RepID=A0ABW9Z8L1_9FLAO|nr:aminodeoxychorismate/anthranilate synthase component II [Flavobacterium ichthyis]NBL64174.1 aminodeoxychorismate/anthranilate synthase component II [Flavobacterium ichthyis]